MKLSLTTGKRFILFALITLFCYFLTSLAVGLILYLGGNEAKWLRIGAVVQDMFLFIIPAVATALLCTRLPARFLCIDRAPNWSFVLVAWCTLTMSIPAMNQVIAWNESMHLPESMAAVEQAMRHAEDAARAQMSIMLGGDSVMNLVVSLLIVAVLAAFSEELFFRGTFQRLFTTANVNVHVAVWVVAAVFSAVHMQFFGFIPRLLLGAFFGYLLVWSGCLWVPVLAHMFNNAVYVLGNWAMTTQGAPAGLQESNLDTLGRGDWQMVAGSLVLTAIGIVLLYRQRLRTPN